MSREYIWCPVFGKLAKFGQMDGKLWQMAQELYVGIGGLSMVKIWVNLVMPGSQAAPDVRIGGGQWKRAPKIQSKLVN